MNGVIIPMISGPRPPDALTWTYVVGYKVVLPVRIPEGRAWCSTCFRHFAALKSGEPWPHRCIGDDCTPCNGPCRGHPLGVVKTCRTRAEAEAVLESARKEIGDEERQVECFK